jgi:ELWxxDGT repeat protein
LLAGDTSFSLHQFGDTVLGVIDDQVFQTDGTPGGSRFFPSLEYLSDSAEVGGQLFLAASSAGAGNELWFLEASDGTPKLILDIAPGLDSSSPSLLTAAGVEGDPRAVFFARTDEHGAEPWTSDGTPSGTRLLRDVRVGPEGSKPWTPWGPNGSRMAFLGDRAFFVADDGVCGEELWVTDGTPLGTVPFVDLYPGPIGSSPEGLTVVEGRLYFVAGAPGLGRELWSTDGTTLGTSPVADLNPGEGSSLPEFLTPYDGNLFFTAYAPETGAELRALNLDSGQVTLVNDINPGPDSSSPATLVPGEGLLWFAATDGVHGHELWRLELDGLFVDGFESGDTTRWTQN